MRKNNINRVGCTVKTLTVPVGMFLIFFTMFYFPDPSLARVVDSVAVSRPEATVFAGDVLPGKAVWDGSVRINGIVTVPAGITLEIRPGTTVRFGAKGGLLVYGRLLALGTEAMRIRFTPAGEKKSESWGEIVLQEAGESRIVNADFEYASWGIHSHFTRLVVRNCTFRNGYGGIRFRSGPLTISDSLFADNSIGIRAFRGTAEIRHNQITRNKKGIFVREQGGGLLITNNNIFDNEDYNIWVGDFNTEDISAPRNWWGRGDPVKTFFDARREPGIGLVLFEPPLSAPLDIAIIDQRQK